MINSESRLLKRASRGETSTGAGNGHALRAAPLGGRDQLFNFSAGEVFSVVHIFLSSFGVFRCPENPLNSRSLISQTRQNDSFCPIFGRAVERNPVAYGKNTN